jgi:hypothetical protein
MSKTFSNGDRVKWKSHGGEAHGKVVKKQTEPTQIKGHKVAASAAQRHSSGRPPARTGSSLLLGQTVASE